MLAFHSYNLWNLYLYSGIHTYLLEIAYVLILRPVYSLNVLFILTSVCPFPGILAIQHKESASSPSGKNDLNFKPGKKN